MNIEQIKFLRALDLIENVKAMDIGLSVDPKPLLSYIEEKFSSKIVTEGKTTSRIGPSKSVVEAIVARVKALAESGNQKGKSAKV